MDAVFPTAPFFGIVQIGREIERKQKRECGNRVPLRELPHQLGGRQRYTSPFAGERERKHS